jgi:crotonobetainyl-CoA:carnitine CoA-transferase CaiB-like acyl-CoA transferase
VIGRDAPADLARYGRSAARLAVADELDGLVADWLGGRDRETALAAFRAERVPVAPVNEVAGLASDPHVRARGSLEVFQDPAVGAVTLVAPAPKLGGTPGRHTHAGPALGAHSEAVLREWLALAPEEIERLRAENAI